MLDDVSCDDDKYDKLSETCVGHADNTFDDAADDACDPDRCVCNPELSLESLLMNEFMEEPEFLRDPIELLIIEVG